MATDQFVVQSEPVESKRAPRRPAPRAPQGPRWGRGLLILLILAGLGAGGYYIATEKDREQRPSERRGTTSPGEKTATSRALPRVEVVTPKRGGMEKTTDQPGTVHAFDFAQLYAKVSGYVKEVKVDRGSRVKQGDLLVELYVPELVAAVAQAEAALLRANAAVDLAVARVTVADETIKARLAKQEEAQARWHAATAQREYREKQFGRISDLVARRVVEERLRDEEQDRFDSAIAEEYATKSAVETAKAEVAEARAELIKANADLKGARADVKVSDATLEQQKALESYTHIKSPYTGVVIFRGEGVHTGAFIPSADKGASEPILTVARDDVMRTIIPVPDNDVPYCDLGDPAIVRVDALRGREFKGMVSRIAESEDVNDRTMRVEVDLENPVVDPKTETRVLRDGMYGRAVIILEKATNHLTIPSKAILSRDDTGKGMVEIVRDGKMYRQSVVVGRDTGTDAEIIGGLEPDSQVILQPDIAMADGTPVEVELGGVAEAPKVVAPEHS
jgi:HlyD family secretion protein